MKEAGVKLAVASSKPEVYVERILEHFGLKSYFDVVTGSDLNGSRCEKEEVVEETLRRLAAVCGENDDDVIKAGEEIDRSAGAMVGDRKFDISGAKEFGLTSIGVSYGYAAKGELKKLGFEFTDSQANFIFAAHPQYDAGELFEALKKKKIYVRHWDSERIRQYLRITVGTREEMEQLFTALREYL